MRTPATDAMPDLPAVAVLQAEAERLDVPLSPQQLDQFARYLHLLGEWRTRAGLTSITDPAELQRRHFGESLALLVALRRAGLLTVGEPLRMVDVGSGAGLPGLAMCIAEPQIELTLVESHGRRCEFLRTVAAALGLDTVTVVQARAEEAGRDPELREHFDLAVARALAAMPVLLEYTVPLLRPGGVLACPKGGALDDELAAIAGERGAAALLGVTIEPPLPLPLPPGLPVQRVAIARRSGPLDARYPRRTGIPTKRPLGASRA